MNFNIINISEEEAFGAYKYFLIDTGDLLIACLGISVDRFDEKIAFVGEEHLPLYMNTSTMRFKTIDENVIDIKYFQYFIRLNLFKNQIRRPATGSAQLNFGPSHVASCNIEAKRIWLNLELVKKPPECLEYILVYELVYLLECHHNDRFRKYMDKFLPEWREHRNLLNKLPLAYEDWQY